MILKLVFAMNRKFMLVPGLAIILVTAGFAQSEKPKVKLTKSEKIWMTAYDDTTRALARLFIKKRDAQQKKQKTMYIALGVSSVALIGGGLLLTSDLNSSTSSYSPTNYTGLGLMLAGSAGVIISSTSLGISFISLNPYTQKKYNKLIDMHKEKKPLPEFYLKRMVH